MKVVCTVVLVLASGAREVRNHEPGFVAKEGVRDYNEMLLVHFPDLPQEPTARWVRENDCLYVEQSAREVEAEAALRKLADQQAREDRERWHKATKALLRKQRANKHGDKKP